MKWTSDPELFQLMRQHLSTAIIGDVLDLYGYTHQFLMPECRPLGPGMMVCGRAFTVVEIDVEATPDPPFGLMLKALDALQENEVYVAAGSSTNYALWGELMSTAARARGAVGAVLAGYARDTRAILEMNFPVFCYGSYAQDQRGRGHVVDYRVPVTLNGVTIQPGDIVFGDVDGVVVLPSALEVPVVTKALEQVKQENTARKMLIDGASAEAVFSTTGVL